MFASLCVYFHAPEVPEIYCMLGVVGCSLSLTSVAGRNLRFFGTMYVCVLIAVSHLAFSLLGLFPFHILLSNLLLTHLVLCNGVVETVATEAYYFMYFFLVMPEENTGKAEFSFRLADGPSFFG